MIAVRRRGVHLHRLGQDSASRPRRARPTHLGQEPQELQQLEGIGEGVACALLLLADVDLHVPVRLGGGVRDEGVELGLAAPRQSLADLLLGPHVQRGVRVALDLDDHLGDQAAEPAGVEALAEDMAGDRAELPRGAHGPSFRVRIFLAFSITW